MKAGLFARLLVPAALLQAALAMLPVRADTAGDCRQEAELYAIPQEQFDDYVQGCIQSRGGDLPVADGFIDAAPAALQSDPNAGVPTGMTVQDNSGVEGIPDGAN